MNIPKFYQIFFNSKFFQKARKSWSINAYSYKISFPLKSKHFSVFVENFVFSTKVKLDFKFKIWINFIKF